MENVINAGSFYNLMHLVIYYRFWLESNHLHAVIRTHFIFDVKFLFFKLISSEYTSNSYDLFNVLRNFLFFPKKTRQLIAFDVKFSMLGMVIKIISRIHSKFFDVPNIKTFGQKFSTLGTLNSTLGTSKIRCSLFHVLKCNIEFGLMFSMLGTSKILCK